MFIDFMLRHQAANLSIFHVYFYEHILEGGVCKCTFDVGCVLHLSLFF
jgi:hypothetical protein